jgi:hypothetical protein
MSKQLKCDYIQLCKTFDHYINTKKFKKGIASWKIKGYMKPQQKQNRYIVKGNSCIQF